MLLFELFNKPGQFELISDTPEQVEYRFVIGQLQYKVTFDRLSGPLWNLNFVQKINRKPADRVEYMAGGTPYLTRNVGHKATDVFSTIVAITKHFIENSDPQALLFTRDLSEQSRVTLYRKLVKRLVPPNWKVYKTVITPEQDPVRQARERYIITPTSINISILAKPLTRFNIPVTQWM